MLVIILENFRRDLSAIAGSNPSVKTFETISCTDTYAARICRFVAMFIQNSLRATTYLDVIVQNNRFEQKNKYAKFLERQFVFF